MIGPNSFGAFLELRRGDGAIPAGARHHCRPVLVAAKAVAL
jgi:hypothetical protein